MPIPSSSSSYKIPLQRSRSKPHSVASISDLGINSSSSGSSCCSSSGFGEEVDVANATKNSRVLDPTIFLLTKSSLKSLICLLIPFLFVSLCLTQKGIWVLTSYDTLNWRQNDSECPIPEWTYPNCKAYLDTSSLPSSTPEEWYDLREKYEQVVGVNSTSLESSWKSQDPSNKLDGFHVKVEIRTSPGKGRGTFLMESVTEGQIIWDNRYTARFPDECTVRQYFEVVGEAAACDTIMWGYVNDFFGQGLQFQVDLDDAVYFNEATDASQANAVQRFPRELLDPKILNLTLPAFLERRRKPGAFQLLAKSDLAAGTELLVDYTDIHVYGKLYWYEKLCIMSRGVWGWLVMQ